MKLYIGNKNYSSWSLRPWLLMKQAEIAFEEIKLRLDFEDGSAFKQALSGVTPAGRVPVLVDDDGFAVWDTLAIAEYLADKFPEKALWPGDRLARARARSLCAEMHSGFQGLRNHCPMNLEAVLPEVGERLVRDVPEVRRDLSRLIEMWEQQFDAAGGPFLFGGFSIADAYYGPVCTRIQTYALPVPADVQAYVSRVRELPAMKEWTSEALAEGDFLLIDEPYRKQV